MQGAFVHLPLLISVFFPPHHRKKLKGSSLIMKIKNEPFLKLLVRAIFTIIETS